MLRNLVLLLILLAPVASAGIRTSTETLEPGTGDCDSDSWNNGHSTYWYDNTSYYSQGYSNSGESSGCWFASDVFRGSVESNDHEVVSAHAGDRSNQSEGNNSFYAWESYGAYSNDSYSYYQQSSQQSNGYSQNAAAREASVSTFVGALEVRDGCDSSRSSYEGDYGQWSSSSGGPSYSSSSSYYGSSASDGCGRSATAATDVTTVSAGDGSRCTSNSNGNSYQSSGDYDYVYDAYSSSNSACNSGPRAQAGAAELALGSRQSCYGFDHSHDDSWYGNDSQSYSNRWQSCESRFGLFGPDGLAVYYGEQSSHSQFCKAGQECQEETWTTPGQVVIQHDIVGWFGIGVPTVPTLPTLP